jgi:hypothetical protein
MADALIPAPACSRCGASMSPGILKDAIGPPESSTIVVFPEWMEGVPLRPGFLSELSFGKGVIDYTKAKRRVVVTYCCNECGFLESYALPAGVPVRSVFPHPDEE